MGETIKESMEIAVKEIAKELDAFTLKECEQITKKAIKLRVKLDTISMKR